MQKILGIDYGDIRTGLALGDTRDKFSVPFKTIATTGKLHTDIGAIIASEEANMVVLGLPRNLDGDDTAQTTKVRQFGQQLVNLGVELIYQDEAGTSSLAEESLKKAKKPYTKANIDSRAAAIILQDYLDLC